MNPLWTPTNHYEPKQSPNKHTIEFIQIPFKFPEKSLYATNLIDIFVLIFLLIIEWKYEKTIEEHKINEKSLQLQYFHYVS